MLLLLLALLLTVAAFAVPACRNCRGWGNPDSHTIAQGKQPRGSRGKFLPYPPLAPLYPVHQYATLAYSTTVLVLLLSARVLRHLHA